MAKKKFETEEELKVYMEDQATKLGEVYSQCWESDDFKKDFMADPKKVFDKFGIDYAENKDYRVLDTPPKTIIQVLPYENTKKGVESLAARLMKTVEDLKDDESKQILLEDWKWEVYQNTEDLLYLPIPLCPENLSPEELEMVNGGCIIAAIFFFVAAAAVETTAVEATAVFTTVITAVEFVMDVAVAVLVAAAAVEAALIGTTLVAVSQAVASTITMYTASNPGPEPAILHPSKH